MSLPATIPAHIERAVDDLLYRALGRVMRHFVVLSAKNEEEILRRTATLRAQGFQTSFDLMVEDISDPTTLKMISHFYRELLGRMNWDACGNIVVKPTALGLHSSNDREVARRTFRNDMEGLLIVANTTNTRLSARRIEIEVDAESLRTIDEAFRVVAEIRNEFPLCPTKIRVAVPMHLAKLSERISQFHLLDHPIRVVKGTGVYNEETSALVGDDEMLSRYERYFLECLAQKKHPYIATMRDKNMLLRLLHLAEDLGYRKDEFTIQMLYGLWTGFGRELLSRGYQVTLYVPATLPWCAHASDGYVRRRVSMFRKLFFQHMRGAFLCKH